MDLESNISFSFTDRELTLFNLLFLRNCELISVQVFLGSFDLELSPILSSKNFDLALCISMFTLLGKFRYFFQWKFKNSNQLGPSHINLCTQQSIADKMMCEMVSTLYVCQQSNKGSMALSLKQNWMQGWQYGKGPRPIFWLSLGIIFSLSLTSYVDLNSLSV